MKVLVTGATGFIGSQIVSTLKQNQFFSYESWREEKRKKFLMSILLNVI